MYRTQISHEITLKLNAMNSLSISDTERFKIIALYHQIESEGGSNGLKPKIQKNRNFCTLVPEILSSLGFSQFRFRYQSFRLHLSWSWNRTEMESNYYQYEENAIYPLKALYQNTGIEK